MIVSAKMDFLDNSLKTQLTFINKFEIKYFHLSKIENSFFDSFYNITTIEKKLKLQNVYSFDSNILIDDIEIIETIELLNSAYLFQKKIKSKYICIKIKNFELIKENKKEIEKYFNTIKKILKSNIIIIPDNNQNAMYFKQLFEEFNIKNFYILFSPAYFYNINIPPMVAYRLLKKYIKIFLVNDIKNNRYTIIGDGVLKILDIFKNLYRDNYSGLILYDDILAKEFARKPKSIFSIFKKTETIDNHIYDIYSKIKIPFDPKKPQGSYLEVLENQIKVLKTIFPD